MEKVCLRQRCGTPHHHGGPGGKSLAADGGLGIERDTATSIVGAYGVLLVFTVAELLLSPVGLSLATKLAPTAFHTQMVALFFLSVALGTAMAGVLAEYYSADRETVYFGVLGLVAIALGIVLALFGPLIRRLMSGVH